jgi:hypothetical protein
MYADDIVLMADSEDDLQKMLDTLNNWTTLWHLEVKKKDFSTNANA